MTTLTNSISKIVQFAAGALTCLLIVIGLSTQSQAQPVVGAQNTALGGGGTAYITGPEATFGNPANLSVNDQLGNIHIGIGQIGILYEPVLSTDIADDQFFNFTDSFYPFKPSAVDITSSERDNILEKNYPRNSRLSQHQTRADIILGGITWHRGDAAFSLAARARVGSHIEVGRGWYSEEFVASGDKEIRDFTLNQYINQQIELSLGYSREFTFIEGLLPRLSKLYIGIAPKFVISGPSFNAAYDTQYIRSDDGTSDIFVSDVFYRTTGEYSQMTSDYIASSNPRSAIGNNLSKKLRFETTGLGMGFDFGLTYLIPLGDDLNIIEDKPDKSVVSNSIRVSLSVNDIGMIRYTEKPFAFSSPRDSTLIGSEPPKQQMFIGSGGQYLSYFDNTSSIPNPILNSENENKDSFSALLPTSLNAGVLIDFTRVKLMGDLSVGLNNTAFTSTKLGVHVGLELRPIKPIPIRMGARIAAGTPTHIGLGSGIETQYWDFNIGTQVILRSRTFTSELVGGAFAGIQLHL